MPQYRVRMGAVDGAAAARRMLELDGSVLSGLCLSAVWRAYADVGAATVRNSTTALDAWNKSEGKHPGDRNPPAGVPVWWGARPGAIAGSNDAAGDVVISTGGGQVVATDGAGVGAIGVMSIDDRESQINRPYLGWTEQIFDQPIDFEGVDDVNADEVREIIRQELRAILEDGDGRSAIGSAVWGFRMRGQAFEGNMMAAPEETAGERLRNVRRSTMGLKRRTLHIEAAVAGAASDVVEDVDEGMIDLDGQLDGQ
jgi:hypothetical protein